MKDYLIWFPSDIEIDGTMISKGYYPVQDDNRTSNQIPTVATIHIAEDFYLPVPINCFGLSDYFDESKPYAIDNEDDGIFEGFMTICNGFTKQGMHGNIVDILRSTDVLVHEFIYGEQRHFRNKFIELEKLRYFR